MRQVLWTVLSFQQKLNSKGEERERERERERKEKGENLTLPTLSALMQPALGSWAYTENTHSL